MAPAFFRWVSAGGAEIQEMTAFGCRLHKKPFLKEAVREYRSYTLGKRINLIGKLEVHFRISSILAVSKNYIQFICINKVGSYFKPFKNTNIWKCRKEISHVRVQAIILWL